jgi:hypothetical protein
MNEIDVSLENLERFFATRKNMKERGIDDRMTRKQKWNDEQSWTLTMHLLRQNAD